MSIQANLQQVMARIESARQKSSRVGPVTLMAVSKTQSPARMCQAYLAGLRHFGENYLQEGLAKQRVLGHLAITWHFIGPIQSNKTRAIASRFHWVHSLDRLKVARRLSEQRPEGMGPLNVCIQVNIGNETSKSGVSPDQVESLACAIRALPNLRLRGLMAIPPVATTLESQLALFKRLRVLQESLSCLHLDTLSMGMSADLEAAIQEGATMVRIGTALFGPRPSQSQTSND